MGKKYEIDILDVDAMQQIQEDWKHFIKRMNSEDFMQFIGQKCMLELNRISNEKLGGFAENDMFTTEIDKYRVNHVLETKSKELIISNDTMADLSHLSEKTASNYPDGFSIAKAIEFGTGILGTPDNEFKWETQVSENKSKYEKGWYYERDGHLYWSKGFGGKFIYYELRKVVEEKIPEWFNEYVDTFLK